jgi:hypothetical protein
VAKRATPNTDRVTLYLPMPKVCIERTLKRSGFDNPEDLFFDVEAMSLSSDLFRWMDADNETLDDLNAVAEATAKLGRDDLPKLYAAAEFVEPASAYAICMLAENLDRFEYILDVSTPEEYGRYMIIESGHFSYDAELDEFYDFEGYGNRRIENEQGLFLDSGYIAYLGLESLEELLARQNEVSEQGMGLGMA